MHELSLCQNIIKIVKEQAATHHKKQVWQINITVGSLLAVDCEAMAFWFNVLAEGSVAEQAKLNVINVAGNELIVKSMEAE